MLLIPVGHNCHQTVTSCRMGNYVQIDSCRDTVVNTILSYFICMRIYAVLR